MIKVVLSRCIISIVIVIMKQLWHGKFGRRFTLCHACIHAHSSQPVSHWPNDTTSPPAVKKHHGETVRLLTITYTNALAYFKKLTYQTFATLVLVSRLKEAKK